MSELVLVAGASGRLGRELVRALAARGSRGSRVRALGRDRSRLAPLEHIAHECMVGDALDPAVAERAVAGVDRVISCVGASVIPLPRYGGRKFSRVDTPANLNLLRAAEKQGVAKFLYVSVFGHDRLPHRDFVFAHERVVEALKSSGLPYAVVRPTGFFHSMDEIVLVSGRGLLPEHRGGFARTNPIHEVDLARYCLDMLFDPSPALERNVGGPDVLTRREIADMAERSLPPGSRLYKVPVWMLRAGGWASMPVSPRVGHLMVFIADILEADFVAPCYGEHHMADFFRRARGGTSEPASQVAPR